MKRWNTLNLDRDLGSVELLLALERSFGITLTEKEAAELVTMGQLENLVRQKLEERPDFDPIWAMLAGLAAAYGSAHHPIDRDTTFFAKGASPR
ncbi:hypothetical protein JYP51_10965 [Ponticoccus gilvus]|nr:hypothetical protein [Enemella evansiae]